MLSRRVATIVTLVIVAAFVVVSIAPAFAAVPALLPQHAKLVGSTPKDGSSVTSARAVTLEFNEDVNPNFVVVKATGPSGDETDGDATTDGGAVTQPLTGDLPAGEHVIAYRVVSVDGHPVSGTLTFTTTQGPATASPSPSLSATAAPTAAETPAASPAPSVVASPQPTVSAAPASQESGGGVTPWLVVGALALLAALGLGAAWRTVGGRGTDADADGAELPGDGAGAESDPTSRAPSPPA